MEDGTFLSESSFVSSLIANVHPSLRSYDSTHPPNFHAVRGDADLEDVDAVLGLGLDEEEVLKEYGTLSGFLCFCAGEIPRVGDFVMSRGWNFEIAEADEKRVFQVRVERLLGFFEGEDATEDDENVMKGFFKRKLASSDESAVEADVDGTSDESLHMAVAAAGGDVGHSEVSHAEAVSRQARAMNASEASRVERLVEQNEMKAAEVVSERQAAAAVAAASSEQHHEE